MIQVSFYTFDVIETTFTDRHVCFASSVAVALEIPGQPAAIEIIVTVILLHYYVDIFLVFCISLLNSWISLLPFHGCQWTKYSIDKVMRAGLTNMFQIL